MYKWCNSCSLCEEGSGLVAFWNLYRCGLEHSILEIILCLAYLPETGKLLFHFPALPQISCVWPWASYNNPSGLESPSCKLEIILLHPLWLCLYILQALWGTASHFLFVWQIVLSTMWSWSGLCCLDSTAMSYIFISYQEDNKKSLWVSLTLQWEQDAGVLREPGVFWRWILV